MFYSDVTVDILKTWPCFYSYKNAEALGKWAICDYFASNVLTSCSVRPTPRQLPALCCGSAWSYCSGCFAFWFWMRSFRRWKGQRSSCSARHRSHHRPSRGQFCAFERHDRLLGLSYALRWRIHAIGRGLCPTACRFYGLHRPLFERSDCTRLRNGHVHWLFWKHFLVWQVFWRQALPQIHPWTSFASW